MPALTRWEPFRDLMTLQDRLNRMLNEPFGGFGPFSNQEALTGGAFVPPVDVYEDEHSIRLKMEVPGIDEKDIDIRLENNMLTVRGERKLESETKQENYHRMERSYGSFTRSFSLPSSVNPDDVKAGYNKGVLTVTLGKRAEARPKQIRVDVKPELTEKTVSAASTEKGEKEKKVA
jgi:HSP20 family protein